MFFCDSVKSCADRGSAAATFTKRWARARFRDRRRKWGRGACDGLSVTSRAWMRFVPAVTMRCDGNRMPRSSGRSRGRAQLSGSLCRPGSSSRPRTPPVRGEGGPSPSLAVAGPSRRPTAYVVPSPHTGLPVIRAPSARKLASAARVGSGPGNRRETRLQGAEAGARGARREASRATGPAQACARARKVPPTT